MIITAQPATAVRDALGEGVLWDDRTGEIVWVDILDATIIRGRLTGARDVRISSSVKLSDFVGAVALAEDGGMLAAGARGLVAVSPEGDISYGPDLMGDRRDVRWNDGSVDPQGRFLVGSLALTEPAACERLLRIDAEGNTDVLRTGLTLSNGIGFSPGGGTIYHVDSLAGTVAAHSYGPGPFRTDEPWDIILDGFEATPDGLTVDTDGHLWVAEWGAGRVRQFRTDGTLLQTVQVDAPQTTCPAFVGEKLDILAITTATTGLDQPAQAGSGFLHLAHPRAKGQPTPRWPGSTRNPFWLNNPAGQLQQVDGLPERLGS